MSRPDPLTALGALVRSERERRGLSRDRLLDQLAEQGWMLSRWDIEALECHLRTPPEPEVLVPVAQALGLDREQVFRALGYWWEE